MATASIDKSELEYLKSCRDTLRDINDILNKEKDEKELSAEEELREIKKIMKGESSFHESEKGAN